MFVDNKVMVLDHGPGRTDLFPLATSAMSQGGETIIDLDVLHHRGVIVAVTNTEVDEIEALTVITGDEVDQDLHSAEPLDIGVPVLEHARLTKRPHYQSQGETLETYRMSN